MIKKKNDFKQAFESIKKYLESSSSIVTNIYQADEYNDYPYFYQFITEYKPRKGWGEDDLLANGVSFNKEEALIKSVMETIERWNLSNYSEEGLVYDSYANLKKKNQVLDPQKFIAVSKNQLKTEKYKEFNFNKKTKFYWTKVLDLKGQEYLAPAQLFHFMYQKKNIEPTIRLADSTGAAAGFSFEQALYSSLCELIERDAYSITYYNNLWKKKINLKTIKNKNLLNLINYIEKYYFELHIFDITLDVGVPVFFCVLVDKTDIGPKISVGAKCSVVQSEAIQGSIMEALQGIGATRDILYIKQYLGREYHMVGKSIRPILDRVMLWAEMSEGDLNFLNIQTTAYAEIPEKMLTYQEKVITVIKALKKAGIEEIYWKDTASDVDRERNIYTLKVVIPDLVPICLDGKYAYWGRRRLFEVPFSLGILESPATEKDLNRLPHPLP